MGGGGNSKKMPVSSQDLKLILSSWYELFFGRSF